MNGKDKHILDPELDEGKYSIKDLLDIGHLRMVFEKFSQLTGFTTGLLEYPSMNILISTGWRDVCEKFHRVCPASASHCSSSNSELFRNLRESRQQNIRRCENGMVDGATPIIIRGKCIAFLATGQALFSEPDIERFKRQARLYGFDEKAYIEALQKVPVVSETQFHKALDFLSEIAVMLAERGLKNLEMRERGEKFKVIFDSTFQIKGLMTPDGKLIEANRTALDFVGLDLKDVVNRPFWETHWWKGNEERVLKLKESILRAARGEFVRYEVELQGAGDITGIFDFSIKPVFGQDGNVTFLVPEARNITERKKAEEALRESQDLFSLFIRNSPIYAFIKEVTPTESRVLQASDNYRQMLGISSFDMVGKNMADLFPADIASKITADDWNVVENGVTLKVDEDFNGRNYASIKFPIVQKGKTLLAGYTIDITDRNRAEADRERMEEQLRQSQKMEAIGQLAGGIAHDFNNQLMGIMGYAELLCKRLDDPVLKKDAENILQSARRSSDLTSQLLAFSRKGKYLNVPVNVNKIIEEVISLLQHSIDKRIEIKRVLNVIPLMISGDPTQIQNAMLNLAINAKDALPSGGEIVFTTEKVRMEDVFFSAEEKSNAVKGDYIKICVMDDGIGIDDESKEHIFEPFFTTKQPGKGTGMGLASVYGTVKSHRGVISLDSRLGEGTVFTIFFPLIGDKAEAATNETAPVKPGIKAKILLVDDDEVIRTLVSRILCSLGHEVVTCNDGLEAVELYQRSWRETDLVILDMMMTRMNGRDAFLEMQAFNKDIKALLISGFSIEGEAQSLLDAGMKGFIQKPFSEELLAQELEKVLNVK